MLQRKFVEGGQYSWQHVDDIIDHNKRLQSLPQKSDWGRHVGTIPNIFLELWLNEERARGNAIQLFSEEFNQMVWRKLQDPEWKFLRTDGPMNSLGWRSSK